MACHAGIVAVSLGLAVSNPRNGFDKKFFEAGAEALKKARRKGVLVSRCVVGNMVFGQLTMQHDVRDPNLDGH